MARLLLPVFVLGAALSATAQDKQAADPKTYLKELTQKLTLRWPKNRTINIVCHGHSVPAGFFKTPVVDSLNAYPHLLHAALKKQYPHAVINVIVTAIGGENSTSGSRRFERDVLTHRPNLITIDYALNDRGMGTERARQNLADMIAKAKAKKIPVLLLTPTDDLRAKWDNDNDPLNKQAQMIRDLAADQKVGLVDSFATFKRRVKEGGTRQDLMSQVNHPNRTGHDLVTAELMNWFPK